MRHAICSSLVAMSALMGWPGARSAEAATCTVPTATYPNIQTAVDDPTCSRINVNPGVYIENVLVLRPVTIRGARAGSSFAAPGRAILAPSESTLTGTFTVAAANVTIDGFAITNPGLLFGIIVKTAGNSALLVNNVIDLIGGSNVLTDTTVGIYLEGGPDGVLVLRNRISRVQSFRSAQGILVGDSTSDNPSLRILLAGNLIENNTSSRGAYGIQVNNGASTAATATGFTTVAILNNTIRGMSGGWAHAIGLEGDTPGAVVRGNNISELVAPPITLPTGDTFQDAAGVFFQANPTFATAHVNENNFDLTVLQFGMALHPALAATTGPAPVDGTCNWWGHKSGPGPVGPGVGARVTPKVDFAPWLRSRAPGGSCGADDDDDFDDDGDRDDHDGDDDNDGIRDDRDNDHDNDREMNNADDDDDNDGIADEWDNQSTRESMSMSAGEVLEPNQDKTYSVVTDLDTLLLIAIAETADAGPLQNPLAVQIVSSTGVVVAQSPSLPGRALATAVPLPGTYTIKVRNTSEQPVTYSLVDILRRHWMF